MVTSNTNIANISFINNHLSSDYPELAIQWHKLQGRVQVYAHDNNYKSFTAAWFTNENTNRVFREIRRALVALKEIENNNELSDEQKQKIKSDIKLTIDVELLYLDLRQQIKLAKDEKQFRPEINELKLYLKSKTQAVRAIIKESNMPKALKKNAAPEIFRFYKRSKRFEVNFDSYIAYATTSRDVAQLAHHTAGIVNSATQVSSMLLQAVPAVYAIAVAGTFILGAARSWWNHQSAKKKALSTGLAVAAIGVIAISGALPAVGVFIAGALAVVGTYVDRIKPTMDLFRLIDEKQDELTQTEAKITKLNESNSLTIKVDQKDVAAIQRKLENHLAKFVVKPEEVIALRKLLSEPNITVGKLSNNPLLQSATGTQNAIQLKEFLITAAQNHTDIIKNDIKTLKSQRTKSTTLASNGVLSAVGAILCCIPTPPTILAGVSITAFTTAVNLVVTYDLIPKTMNFFKNLFSKEKTNTIEEMPAKETQKNANRSSVMMKNLHSLNKQQPTQIQEAQQRKSTQEQPQVSVANNSNKLFKEAPKQQPVVANEPEPEVKKHRAT